MSRKEDRRALAALEEMAEEWAESIGLAGYVHNIAANPNNEEQIAAFSKQSFIEGAYRCYLDAKQGKIPWLRVVQ